MITPDARKFEGEYDVLYVLFWYLIILESIMQVTRVNSTNVLDEGLRIGEIGRRMNSKVRLVKISVYQK
jgi:hypothetical protein